MNLDSSTSLIRRLLTEETRGMAWQHWVNFQWNQNCGGESESMIYILMHNYLMILSCCWYSCQIFTRRHAELVKHRLPDDFVWSWPLAVGCLIYLALLWSAHSSPLAQIKEVAECTPLTEFSLKIYLTTWVTILKIPKFSGKSDPWPFDGFRLS